MLLKQLVSEQALTLVLGLLISWCVYPLLLTWWQNQHGSTLGSTQWLFALLCPLVAVLLVFTVQIPALAAPLSRIQFCRDAGQAISPRQRRLRWLNGTLQVSLTLVIATLTLSSWLEQKQFDQQPFPEELWQHRLTPPQTVHYPDWVKRPDDDVAYSNVSTIDPSADYYELPEQGAVKWGAFKMAISSNYLQVIAAHWLTPQQPDDHGTVVINRTLADKLLASRGGHPKEYLSLVGQRLKVQKLWEDNFTIGGVIDDLPHFGNSGVSRPIFYSPLDGSGHQLYLLTGDEQLPSRFSSWAVQEWPGLKSTPQGSLSTLVNRLERAQRVMVSLGQGLTLLLLPALLFTLLSSIGARVEEDKTKLGTQLALGVRHRELHRAMALWLWSMTLAALPLALICLALGFRLTDLAPNEFSLAAFLVSALILLLLQPWALWPLHRQLQRPIAELLRYTG
ncbi:ABC transporter permease [Ferrimonas sediminicola]|uniref:ABC transporter permease n=1 Tax=Ferrimonas sediminicola TaxID=2569538 RepID=A0A4V5NWB6_9GAMM|nr:ABC transporter permease [Ferrimonas sediminicola]TKB46246.1 ABC transporter permease [Ferrimonas sediminicola]